MSDAQQIPLVLPPRATERKHLEWSPPPVLLLMDLARKSDASHAWRGVRCVFRCPATLGPLYAVKDRLPMKLTTHAVYSIKCKTSNAEYVGEKLRPMSVRKKEHHDAIRLVRSEKSRWLSMYTANPPRIRLTGKVCELSTELIEQSSVEWENLSISECATPRSIAT